MNADQEEDHTGEADLQKDAADHPAIEEITEDVVAEAEADQEMMEDPER